MEGLSALPMRLRFVEFGTPRGRPRLGVSASESESSLGRALRPARARGGGAVPGGGSSSV